MSRLKDVDKNRGILTPSSLTLNIVKLFEGKLWRQPRTGLELKPNWEVFAAKISFFLFRRTQMKIRNSILLFQSSPFYWFESLFQERVSAISDSQERDPALTIATITNSLKCILIDVTFCLLQMIYLNTTPSCNWSSSGTIRKTLEVWSETTFLFLLSRRSLTTLPACLPFRTVSPKCTRNDNKKRRRGQ